MVIENSENNIGLVQLALSMLETTNPYKGDITRLHYRTNKNEREDGYNEYSLCDLVRKQLGGKHFSKDARYGDRNNKRTCFDAIGQALYLYAESYPAPASFKMKMRETFIFWLEEIKNSYDIRDVMIPERLRTAEGEKDMLITMIKMLHKRRGTTKKELQEQLGIHPRNIMKNMSRLDPSFSETSGEGSKQPPYMIGGQEVKVKISSTRIEGERERRYITYNTLHPIVLLENVMQIGTLLKGLEILYNGDEEDNIAKGIAIDIWSQLSDYGRKRIETYYFDEDSSFLSAIRDETPDDHAAAYFPEKKMREMMDQENQWMTPEQRLMYYAKASSRICPLVIIDTEEGEQTLTDVQISKLSGRKNQYKLRFLADGTTQTVEGKDIIDILD